MQSKEEIINSWKRSFTNPLEHSDNGFVYLVVCLRTSETRLNTINFMKDRGRYDPTQDIDLRANPEKIDQMHSFSASVVSQKRPYIFMTPGSTSGLIIKCPIENIVHTSYTYLNLSVTNASKSLIKQNRGVSLSVNQLLADKSNYFNEVLIKGTGPQGKVEVIGFFDKPGTKSDFEDKAKEMNLPLIRFEWLSGQFPDDPLSLVKTFLLAKPPAQLSAPSKETYTPGTPAFKPGFLFPKSDIKQKDPIPQTTEKDKTKTETAVANKPSDTGMFGFKKGFLLEQKTEKSNEPKLK